MRTAKVLKKYEVEYANIGCCSLNNIQKLFDCLSPIEILGINEYDDQIEIPKDCFDDIISQIDDKEVIDWLATAYEFSDKNNDFIRIEIF